MSGIFGSPDFFVLRKDAALWVECKTEEKLLILAQDSPNRYQQVEGQWHCPPGEVFADGLGLSYALHSSAQLNPIFGRNFVWLEDYLIRSPTVDEEIEKEVLSVVKDNPGIFLAELQKVVGTASIDDLHLLIGTDCIYVDLSAVPLSCPEQVSVFLNAEVAFTYSRITQITSSSTNHHRHPFKATIGSLVSWDSQPWTIINLGSNFVGLRGEDNLFSELPNEVFNSLIQQKKITLPSTTNQTIEMKANVLSTQIEEFLLSASQEDLEEANRRFRQIEELLNKTNSIQPNRTQQRWLADYRKAERLYGRGFIGLIPQHRHKGNRTAKMEQIIYQKMEIHIQFEYETHKQPSIRHAYQAFKALCICEDFTPPSLETYRLTVRNRPMVEQIQKRQGSRAAYQEDTFSWYLDQEFPIHGQRPFEVCHIDHTPADVELLSAILLNMGMDIEELKKESQLRQTLGNATH